MYVTIKLCSVTERERRYEDTKIERKRGETKCANKANIRKSPTGRATIFPRIPRNRWN